MSLFVNGKNIEMYSGDTGYLNFYGIPTNRIYDMYFSVLDSKRNTIFELNQYSKIVGVNDKNEVMLEMNYGEEISDFEKRVQEAGYKLQGRVTFFLSNDETDMIKVSVGNSKMTYLYGLKMCYENGGVINEDTLLPPVIKNESGKVIFKEPTYLIVYPKYVEGK